MPKKPNLEKYTQYAQTLGKLNRALKQGFYYEALMLDYALIEDRMTELLWYLGLVNKGNPSPVVAKKSKKAVRKLLGLSDRSRFGINKISVKIEILERLCKTKGFDDDYLNDVFEYLENRIGRDNLSAFLASLNEWKDKRNTYVHGLMNEVPSEVEPELTDLAIRGKELFRTADSFCKKTQKCGIRKKYRINPII